MFEWYMAICHRLKHRMIRGKGRAFKMTVMAWLVSLGMRSCDVFNSDLKIYCVEWRDSTGTIRIDTMPVCTPYPIAEMMNNVIIIMDLCQFSVAIIFGAYLMRVIYTLSNRKIEEGDGTEKTASINKARTQVARMLIINAVVFFFCLAPFEIYNIDFFRQLITGSHVITNPIAYLVIGWGGRASMLLNSTINPILYNMINNRYRNASKRAFTCGSYGAKSKPTNVAKIISRWEVKHLVFTYYSPLSDIINLHGLNHTIYADDTQVYILFDPCHRDAQIDLLEGCIKDIKAWAVQNKMKFNDAKT